jgi:hypothetical protein
MFPIRVKLKGNRVQEKEFKLEADEEWGEKVRELLLCLIQGGLEVDGRKIATAELMGKEFRLYTEKHNNLVICYACKITTEFDMHLSVIRQDIRQETLNEHNHG